MNLLAKFRARKAKRANRTGMVDKPEEEQTIEELLQELAKTQGPGDSLIVISIPPEPEEEKDDQS